MPDTDARPMLAEARQAADSYLLHKVVDDGMPSDAAERMASTGFSVVTRTLSILRTRDGLSEQAIADAFQRRLDEAREAGDEQRVISAEYTLAIWDGMRRDLAAYLSGAGTETQR